MIERYALYDIDKLRDQFQLADGVPRGVKIRYNIVPATKAPVVLQRDVNRTMGLMQWGYVSQGSRDTNSIFRYRTFTVRADDIFKKPMWEKSVRSQRCLVPANGFYTWSKGSGGTPPHYAHLESGTLMALAGVYSSWTDTEGRELGMFSIVTEPADERSSHYTSQQPIVVPLEKQATWLDPGVSDYGSIYEILHLHQPSSFLFTPVRTDIYSKKIDTPDLLG